MLMLEGHLSGAGGLLIAVTLLIMPAVIALNIYVLIQLIYSIFCAIVVRDYSEKSDKWRRINVSISYKPNFWGRGRIVYIIDRVIYDCSEGGLNKYDPEIIYSMKKPEKHILANSKYWRKRIILHSILLIIIVPFMISLLSVFFSVKLR